MHCESVSCEGVVNREAVGVCSHCVNCLTQCENCDHWLCYEDENYCDVCDGVLCIECAETCAECGGLACAECKRTRNGKTICERCA